jgi:DNA-binding NarL/FixJ family response regulator
MNKDIRLGIVEDEPIMLRSLRQCFEDVRDVQIKFAVPSMEECFDLIRDDRELDVLLLDIKLPGMSGIEGIPRLLDRIPALDIVMLTNSDDSESIFRCLQAGATSYISKKKVNLSILRDAVYTVYRGGSYMSPSIARKVIQHFPKRKRTPVSVGGGNPTITEPLTDRQQDIVEGLVAGKSYKQIAEDLSISLETVRDHIKKIYRKLQVRSKADVIRKKLGGEI